MKAVNYFINQENGEDIYTNRDDFPDEGFEEDTQLRISDAKERVAEIADHYCQIINSGSTLFYYLCFDLSIGLKKRKKGYTLDHDWAEGVYEAAKIDLKVYTRLIEVVSENLKNGVMIPRLLKKFIGEVNLGEFPISKRQYPANTKDKLRNLAVFECLDLLVRRMNMQLVSYAKVPRTNASTIIEEAFSQKFQKDSNVAELTPSIIKNLWSISDRKKMRYEISMIKWLEEKEKPNRWFKKYMIINFVFNLRR